MADESGVGEVSDIFTDVQPRNRTETDTEVSSDLLESLIEAVFLAFGGALLDGRVCLYSLSSCNQKRAFEETQLGQGPKKFRSRLQSALGWRGLEG